MSEDCDKPWFPYDEDDPFPEVSEKCTLEDTASLLEPEDDDPYECFSGEGWDG